VCVCIISLVNYLACKSHIFAPRFIVTCGLSDSAIFFSLYPISGTIFGKTLLKNSMCFLHHFLSETFLMLIRIQGEIITDVHTS